MGVLQINAMVLPGDRVAEQEAPLELLALVQQEHPGKETRAGTAESDQPFQGVPAAAGVALAARVGMRKAVSQTLLAETAAADFPVQ